jgi:hypothetical protein
MSRLTGALSAASLCAVLLAWPAVVSSHPCEDYYANALPDCYGRPEISYPVEWSYRDITFVEAYPDPATLSDAEKYMLRGCSDAAGEPNGWPWLTLVMYYARLYYSRFGALPEQLTPDVCAAAYGKSVDQLPPGDLEWLVSPLTGDYPYLSAESFSPGNVYLRILTDDEMMHFASLAEWYRTAWYEGYIISGGEKHEVTYIPPVFYIRVYGTMGVIHNALTYGFAMARE